LELGETKRRVDWLKEGLKENSIFSHQRRELKPGKKREGTGEGTAGIARKTEKVEKLPGGSEKN